MKKTIAILAAVILCMGMFSVSMAEEAAPEEKPMEITLIGEALEGDILIVLDGTTYTGSIGTKQGESAWVPAVSLVNGASWTVTDECFVKTLQIDESSEVIGGIQETEDGVILTPAADGESAAADAQTAVVNLMGNDVDFTYVIQDGTFEVSYSFNGNDVVAKGTVEADGTMIITEYTPETVPEMYVQGAVTALQDEIE